VNLAPTVKPKRSYRSAVRTERASATRARILEAARRLFERGGYAATGIEAIAADAGTAAETVYLHFGSKRGLLAALLDVALVGDDAPVALLDRPWMRSVRRIGDAPGRIRALARITRRILDRVGPIHTVLRGAAQVDPEVAALAMMHARRRLEGQGELVAWIADAGGLRRDLDQHHATERYFALTSPELHHLFSRELGWSGRRYETWLNGALLAELLD